MKYFNLTSVILIGLLMQAAYLFALIFTLAHLSPLIFYTMWGLGILVALFIVSGSDAAEYRMSWAVRILLFPAVMGAVYLFYNRRITGRSVNSDMLSARKHANKHSVNRSEPEHSENKRLAAYIEKTCGTPPASCTEAKYFGQGEEFRARFLEELEKAERYIFIEFFIIERGKMWGEILAVLTQKVAQGVEVRVIYDGFGSLYALPRNYYKRLREMGIKCMVFNPVRAMLSFRLNTRNHRKLAVIDGAVAFCAGLNLADKYVNAKKPLPKTGHWKDSAVMVAGEAAWGITLSFMAVWEFLTRRRENYTSYTPAKTAAHIQNTVSFWNDIPLDNEPVSERVFLSLINRASSYVYIITPYLMPGEEIISALTMQARMGADVRIILPFLPDKYMVMALGKSNYRPLLEAGIRLFEYPPGFIHSKIILSDDLRAAVSTVNLDYRALYMHYECGLCFYGEEIISSIKRDFLETQELCHEVTLGEHEKAGVLRRGVRRFARLFAPLA